MFRVLLYNSTKTYECIQNASTYLFWMLLRQGQTKNKNQSLWLHLPMLPQVLQKSTPYSPQEKKGVFCSAKLEPACSLWKQHAKAFCFRGQDHDFGYSVKVLLFLLFYFVFVCFKRTMNYFSYPAPGRKGNINRVLCFCHMTPVAVIKCPILISTSTLRNSKRYRYIHKKQFGNLILQCIIVFYPKDNPWYRILLSVYFGNQEFLILEIP